MDVSTWLNGWRIEQIATPDAVLGVGISPDVDQGRQRRSSHHGVHLCRMSSAVNAMIEMYDDPDATPVLWDFLWSGSESANPLRLPFAPDGTPAVTWHSPERTADYHAGFERWRASGTVDERFMPSGELDDLVAVLREAVEAVEAVEAGRGVFVFYEGG